jgi:Outer membrane protein beta-barrel domain
MKKLFFICCLAITKFVSYGQSFNFGVLAGANVSTFAYSNLPYEPSSEIVGFHIGVFAEIKKGNLSIEPGLVYASIGGKNGYYIVGGGGSNIGTYKSTVQYLQVPVNFLYNIPVVFGKVFFGAGPYIGFGLSGKNDQTGVLETNGFSQGNGPFNVTTKYKFSNADNPDFGVNAVAGIHFKNNFLITLDYQYGLKYLFNYSYNVGNDYPNNSIPGAHNSVASLSIGYEFK